MTANEPEARELKNGLPPAEFEIRSGSTRAMPAQHNLTRLRCVTFSNERVIGGPALRIRPIMPAAIFIVLTMACITRAQSQKQVTSELWFEVDPTWNLNKRWVIDVDVVQHFARADPRWWETGATPNLEFSLRKWIAFEGGLGFIYTSQGDKINTFETRPYLGVKLKLQTWRGIKMSLYSRYEARFQTDLDTGHTAFAPRSRNRLQVMIPMNNRSLSDNGTFYVVLDA